MRVVVAPDKFKGSLSGREVAASIAAGIRAYDPSADVIEVPLADGGEGTLDAAVAAGFELRNVRVVDAMGSAVDAHFAVRDGVAVVEMARASGLVGAPDADDAVRATSRGTGELMRAALDSGCRELVLGIGGSASTDGGAGALQALGVRLLDADGAELSAGGGALVDLAAIDLSGLDSRLDEVTVVLASDVDAPLLGAQGAARLFGPQKGASAEAVEVLERGLARFVEVLAGDARAAGRGIRAAEIATRAGAGAAGGVGFAAMCVLGARRRPGIEVVLELTGFSAMLDGADAVVTGEGSLDVQSLMGKTPVGVARMATASGVPVWAVCGRNRLSGLQARAAGFAGVLSLAQLEPDPVVSMNEAAVVLQRVSADLAARILTELNLPAPNVEPYDLVLRGERIFVDREFRAAEIGVRNGTIVRIADAGTGLRGEQLIDAAPDEVLLPGLVDTHVHVNEPGRTEWEGFASATRAAAAGGVTTIIDMPLNSIPPTTTREALDIKRDVAAGQVFVDVGFWGGVVPGNLDEMRGLVDEGVFGFKCFLLHSGVDEFPAVTAAEMEAAMEVVAEVGSLLVVHAEDARLIDAAPAAHGRAYSEFLASRPSQAEDVAIEAVVEGAARTGASAHILHLSAAGSLDRIVAAKRSGVDLTVETCPHYLALTADEIGEGATAFKCCPPIRESSNRDALWAGLQSGIIDYIVSDHSPSTPDLKYAGGGDFGEAWGGIASLQLGFAVVWSEARSRGIPLERVVEWMSTAPATRAGLVAKGRIAVGAAADFAIIAPDETFVVDARRLEHRHPVTPYDGRELSGVVRRTVLAGRPIDREQPRGELLRRTKAENHDMSQAMLLEEFNDSSRSQVLDLLRPCIDVHRWGEEIADGRPFGSLDELIARARRAARPFTEGEIEAALAHHPRIGEQAAGDGAEATLARGEQDGVDPDDHEVVRALAEGNRRYEEKFGRVFLIRAKGRSSTQILAALTHRLENELAVESDIVAEELREIALLRLKGVFAI